ncbi:helix-turn-helix domain-containing protein [Nonomuraea mesophila]|uniref:helix-turn-helix domain-containing protein n=1 Tax=Nonomuraea mesophila TaxID=2530382 RepID=UPI00140BA345|nr:helix-turn-helix transcriptional regulator [Nonomuraea mesophila]
MTLVTRGVAWTGQQATMAFGEQLRHWRERRKVSLSVLAQATHYSKGYLSRVERRQRSPERLLAELADDVLGADGRLIQSWVSEFGPQPMLGASAGGEATKRRTFLKSASTALVAGGLAELDRNTDAVARLRDALVPNAPAESAGMALPQFSRAMTRARRDFTAARYAGLADDLAELIPIARTATEPAGQTLAAQVYHLAARTLIKLSAPPYAWVAAHQGEQAATASADLRAIAEARRDMVSLFHRAADYGKARDLTARAADMLQTQLAGAAPQAWGAYGALMSTGAIAAARMEDRHSALAMLEEATNAAAKAPALVLSAGHVVTYRIGVSIVLGDAGMAIEHARSISPDDIPTVERRASYYTGVAEAYTLWGKTDRAVRALLVAEKIAPAEVRRSGPRRVIEDLLHRDLHSNLSGLRALARRASVAL